MKTVVVTGGAVRLGKAISDRLRADGWRVLTTSHRAEAGADIVADLSDPMGPARLYAAALALSGGIPPDALVNNAALFTGSEAELEAVNLVAPQKLTMLMAGREGGCGAVVNVLDCRVLNGASSETAYAKSKRSLLDFTFRAAAMFADTLRVNAVAPGPVLVPTNVREKAAVTPLGRPTPETVSEAVAWLLSAAFTTGCVIPVDGGAAAVQTPPCASAREYSIIAASNTKGV